MLDDVECGGACFEPGFACSGQLMQMLFYNCVIAASDGACTAMQC